MSHQDLNVAIKGVKGECLARSLKWLLSGVTWTGISFRQDCSWTPALLAAAAMLWAWSGEPTLKERFKVARRITIFMFGVQHELAKSYQAFIKLLLRWAPELVSSIQVTLRQRMEKDLPECWGIHGYVLFGVDGSRIELPRTNSNEQAYSANRKSKKKKKSKKRKPSSHARKADTPQIWLTKLWHIGTGLPWNWKTGPADSSERAHLMEMLESLPTAAMIVADAGFGGYEYWKAILDSGRHFLIRVGSNVKMLRKLGCARESGNTVYLWPDNAARKNCPPLVLRLVSVHNGKHPVYLVTSVREVSRLSDRQLIDIYKKRWGIELYYRNLKQTFNRRKLRSLSPDNAWLELEWSLVGLWAMGLYTLMEANRIGTPPNKISTAQMLLAFRNTMRDYLHASESGASLRQLLRGAVIDSYTRKNKTSRNYPRKKKEKPPGSPIIKNATSQQVTRAQEVLSL